jgi:hypothetical protein
MRSSLTPSWVQIEVRAFFVSYSLSEPRRWQVQRVSRLRSASSARVSGCSSSIIALGQVERFPCSKVYQIWQSETGQGGGKVNRVA